MIRFFITIVATSILFIFSTFAADKDFLLPVSDTEIKIMSYNVENLFDADHDEGKKDYEFLPKSSPEKENCFKKPNKDGAPNVILLDEILAKRPNFCAELDWTDDKVEMKLDQIKAAISTQGPLPDILVLSEVENPAVISRLVRRLGYDDFRMTESPDVRGIDLAILFKTDKLSLIEFKEIEVKGAMHLTRNLSYAAFRLNNQLGEEVLGVFPNHWPSQASPTKARTIVAKALRDFVDDFLAKYQKDSANIVITGDFNTIDSDSPHPIDEVILDSSWDAEMKDVRELAKKAKNPMLTKMPVATYYYQQDDAWNEFDRFFVNSTLNDKSGLEIDPHSYRINAPSLLTKKNKNNEDAPLRYNHKAIEQKFLGYSDHFGIVMKLKYMGR